VRPEIVKCPVAHTLLSRIEFRCTYSTHLYVLAPLCDLNALLCRRTLCPCSLRSSKLRSEELSVEVRLTPALLNSWRM
jgi:hypothetical protein